MSSKPLLSSHPPPTLTAHRIDFPLQAGIPSYSNHYALVIDDLLSPSECASLLSLATNSSPWKPAAVGPVDANVVIPSYRHSNRILLDNPTVADELYRRILPYIEHEVGGIGPFYGSGILSQPPNTGTTSTFEPTKKVWRRVAPWKLHSLNPRLRFLQYHPSHFFKPHVDATTTLQNKTSFLTLQIYLSPESIEGGATRFYAPDGDRYYDVTPKLGRALIFQQAGLKHSGEEVVSGTKYTARTEFMYVRNGEGEKKWGKTLLGLKYAMSLYLLYKVLLIIILGGDDTLVPDMILCVALATAVKVVDWYGVRGIV